MASQIRIVVCGDPGVGKTSLIASLVKDARLLASGPEQQEVLPPITLPPSYNDGPSCIVIDTPGTVSSRDPLNKELRRAHVIWLVYADHYSYQRISLYWMPYFRSNGINVPIVLCANKCELTSSSDIESDQLIESEMMPLIKEFKEIESCIRSSAITNYNVNQAFYLCQRAVTHPIAPLYDTKELTLKPAAKEALSRIFFLSDKDQDGYLDYRELTHLQHRCFGKSISEQDVDDIFRTLAKANPGAGTLDNGVPGISKENFLLLNKIYAEKGRHETTWAILRAFHYSDSLSLSDYYLYPKLEVPPLSSIELSPSGYKFFVDLFLLFDKDNDGGLSDQELTDLFTPTPGIPQLWEETHFPRSTVVSEKGYITLQGWLAQWSMTTSLDYRVTLAYLAWLGFDEPSPSALSQSFIESRVYQAKKVSTTDALKITKPRRKRPQINGKSNHQYSSYWDLILGSSGGIYGPKKPIERSIFRCLLLGAGGCGKSSIMSAFLSHGFSPAYRPTILSSLAVNTVEMTGGKQCYLIVEEPGELETAVLSNSKRLEECDVLCYAYDSSDPDSFQYIVDLRSKFPELDRIPCLFVALKADLDRQQQRSELQPNDYTRSLGLSAPLHVSAMWPASVSELYVQLAECAMFPSTSTPRIVTDKENNEPSDFPPVWLTGAALSVMLVTATWIWRSSHSATPK
ncbi:hypothetical protein CANCADRAFT_134671 [Tortispora caseinolytica NRRL Y-17796]|uniref:Mitochondrial Rho GTPase n=1 Tax=Tortispora caseinolytica NRRL Y-17796 TaxID=767744 RepID=A0A1E4TBQ3_9ASCO|nr:hypothetical protein CANCADRAFT_134671 [Tortispora caseinolytica NRRL Y-17796]